MSYVIEVHKDLYPALFRDIMNSCGSDSVKITMCKLLNESYLENLSFVNQHGYFDEDDIELHFMIDHIPEVILSWLLLKGYIIREIKR